MKLGYVILYVDKVDETIAFYERAFGLKRKLLMPDEYGELATGTTKLAFVSKSHIKKVLPIPFQKTGLKSDPPPMEVGLVVDDVNATFDRAVAAGATAVAKPAKKPWGQTVGYVRDNNGFLIEICTPVE